MEMAAKEVGTTNNQGASKGKICGKDFKFKLKFYKTNMTLKRLIQC